VASQRLSPHLVHTDAAFTPDEEAYLMFGEKVQCRSSWMQTVQWVEKESRLEVWMESGNSYDFTGMDWPAVQEFMDAYSKGHWYWISWVGAFGRNNPIRLSEEDKIPNRARRILE
jgi:hypothetical protein